MGFTFTGLRFQGGLSAGKDKHRRCLVETKLCETIRRWAGIVENCIPVALSAREIEEASYNDAELSQVKGCVRTGNWEHCTFPSYAHIKDELCIYGEILLRGSRIVVPKTLRDKVVRLAHEGHQGIVKIKYQLKVWWPGMDKDVDQLCKVCHGCQVTSRYDPPEPMSRVLPPSAPWQDCWADLLGPLPKGESILVLVDYFSRFVEVAILKSTTSAKIIEAISPVCPIWCTVFFTNRQWTAFCVRRIRDVSSYAWC